MDPATAALIGAGVASCVNLGAQYFGHVLSLKRERKGQRRDRLLDAVVEAATLLYTPTEEPEPSPASPEPKAGTLGALYPELRDPQINVAHERIGRGITVLQVNFGHEHRLVDSYSYTAGTCLEAEVAKWDHFDSDDEDWRIKNIPDLAKTLRGAQNARDAWMRDALAEVERY